MIIGHGSLEELGILFKFGAGTMIWKYVTVTIKESNALIEESYHIPDNPVDPEYKLTQDILDAKYEPADLQKYVNACMHFTLTE